MESAAMAIDADALQGLRAGDVDVWYVDLAVDAATVAQLAAGLTQDERARAGRFPSERDARRFVVTRGAVRAVLGRYLGVTPRDLAFVYGAHGKPALDGAHAPLGFNVSHSGDVAVVAAGWQRAVGVDVEAWRPLPDLAALAARVFAPAERAVLEALAPIDRPAAFFRCWTRKEAFIKATGQGLAQPLDGFIVSLGEPARFLDIGGDAAALARWTLHDLHPREGYAGALVVERAARAVVVRAWSAEADA
jgi:4'-phosphopantetheinyl transferase